jgi:hypothetical protein
LFGFLGIYAGGNLVGLGIVLLIAAIALGFYLGKSYSNFKLSQYVENFEEALAHDEATLRSRVVAALATVKRDLHA